MKILPRLVFFFLGITFGCSAVMTHAAQWEDLYRQSFDRSLPDIDQVDIEQADGTQGKAAVFSGTQCIDIGDLGTHSAITIEFMMKSRQIERDEEWQGLVTCDPWSTGAFHLSTNAGRIEFYLNQGGLNRARMSSPILQNGRWYRVKLDLDTRTHEGKLLVDDQVVDECEIASSIVMIDLEHAVIGTEGRAEQLDRYFRGWIDEVSIRGIPSKVVRLNDPRNVDRGTVLPNKSYCDQPYIVILDDGTWVCCMTTGSGHEGAHGQHVIAIRSEDQGKTWSDIIDIEPSTMRDASWVVPLLTDYGRIYAFYTYNTDNIRTLNDKPIRADMLGYYCFRYSDDGGRTWSERHALPMRITQCDRTNDWEGKVCIFWGICKPQVDDNDVFFTFTKLGRYMLELGEGWMFHSDNIMTERDVSKIHWNMLPEGEKGIRHPEYGSVQEEHNIVVLDDGSIYCVYRTTEGFPCYSISTDRGKTFGTPKPMDYADGSRIYNPRACPKIWKTKNGKYLFWYHNHSGKSFADRNPAWISGGIERNGKILWSQPEILLYDDDPSVRMSYPDLVEMEGKYWVTETQKTIARLHEIDPTLFEGLWHQLEVTQGEKPAEKIVEGLCFDSRKCEKEKEGPFPDLNLLESHGMTIHVAFDATDMKPGDVICTNRDAQGNGIELRMAENHTIMLDLSNGEDVFTWSSDLESVPPGKHEVTFIVDLAPGIVSCLVDGRLQDGKGVRQFGWGRITTPPAEINGKGKIAWSDAVDRLLVFDRYLRTSEAIQLLSRYHSGPQKANTVK